VRADSCCCASCDGSRSQIW